MKTIIAGSRTIRDYSVVVNAIGESGFEITEVVSGCAMGVDAIGERWAFLNKIPVKKLPADWKQYGKKAGIIRNMLMADYAEALIAVWFNKSKGTKHMIDCANEHGLHVFVKEVFQR